MSELVMRVRAEYDEAVKCREELRKVEQQLKNLSDNASPKEIEQLTKRYADLTSKWENSMSYLGKVGAYVKEAFSNIGNTIRDSNVGMKDLDTSSKSFLDTLQRRQHLEDKVLETLSKQREEAEKQRATAAEGIRVNTERQKNNERVMAEHYGGKGEAFYSDKDREILEKGRESVARWYAQWNELNTKIEVYDQLISESRERTQQMTNAMEEFKNKATLSDAKENVERYRESISTLSRDIEVLNNKKISIQAEITDIDKNINDIKTRQNVDTLLKDNETKYNAQTQATQKLSDEIDELMKKESDLEALQGLVAQNEADNTERLTSLQEEYQETINKRLDLEGKLAESQKKESELLAERDRLNAVKEEKKSRDEQTDALDQQLIDNANKYALQREETKRLSDEIDNLTKRESDLLAQEGLLAQQEEENKDRLATLRDEYSAVVKQRLDAQKKLEASQKKEADLIVEHDNLQAQINKSTDEVAALNDYQAQRDEANGKLEDINASLKEKVSQLNDAKQLLGESRDIVKEIDDFYKGFAETIDAQANMLFKDEATYQKFQALGETIANLQSEITKKVESGNYNISEIQDLQNELSKAQEDFRGMSAEARNAAEEVGDNFASRMSQAQITLFDLNESVRNATADVMILEEKLAKAKAELANSEGKSPADIAAAKKLVDDLQTSLDQATDKLSMYRQKQKDAMDGIASFGKEGKLSLTEFAESAKSLLGQVAATAGIAFSVAKAKQFVDEVVSIRSAMQDLESSLKVFLGSEEKAMAYADKLRNYSLGSLFHYNELMKVSQQMLGIGFNAEEAMDKIDRLANIAAATHQSLSSVVSMYSRAYSMGSVMNRQLVSWQAMGVNVKEVLREMGESAGGSAVSFEKLDKVIMHLTDNGGKFANAQQEMMGNISAAIDSYRNQVELTMNDIGEKYQDVMVDVINFGTDLVKNYEKIGNILMEVIAIYGSYRAALIAVAAAKKLNVLWTNAEAVATRINTAASKGEVAAVTTATVLRRQLTASLAANTKAVLANTAAWLTNPYVLIGAAVAALTYGVYKLATAEEQELTIRKGINKAIDETNEKLNNHKGEVQSLIDTLKDENATEGAQIRAWEQLNEIAPELTKGYTRAQFAALDFDKAQQKVNTEMEDFELKEKAKQLDEYRKNLERYIELNKKAKNSRQSGDALTRKEADEFRGLGDYWEEKELKVGFWSALADGTNSVDATIEAVRKAIVKLDKEYKNFKSTVDDTKDVVKPLKEMSFRELLNELDKTKGGVEDLQKTAEKAVKVNIDDKYLKDAVVAAKSLKDEVKDKIKIDINDKELTEARFNVINAINELERLDVTNAEPEVKKQKIEEAVKKVEAAQAALEALDKTKAAPKLKIVGIDETLEKLKTTWEYFKKIMGGMKVTKENPKHKDTFAELQTRADNANSDDEIDEMLKELNKDAKSKSYDDADRKKLGDLINQLKKKKEKNKLKDDSDKEDKEARQRRQRDYDLYMKNLEQKEKQVRDTENAMAEARIASIHNASKRERAERENQHRLSLEQIDQQIQDFKKKNVEQQKETWSNKKENKDKVWADTALAQDIKKNGYANISLTPEQQGQIDATRAKEMSEYKRYLEEQQKAEREATYELLKVWGDYEEKRFAISKEYEEKIREANSPEERAGLVMQRDKDLEDLNTERVNQQIDWDGVFSDLEGHTKTYLEGLRDQLQALLSSGSVTDITQMATIQEKIQEINGEISKQSGLFDFVGDKQREHNRLVQNAADAQGRLNDLIREQTMLEQLQTTYETQARDILESKGIDRNVDLDKDVLKSLDKDSKEYNQMAALLDKIAIGERKLAKARQDTADATNKATQASDAAKKKTSQAVADWFSDVQQFISEKGLDQIPDLLGELGYGTASEKVAQGLQGFNDAAGAATDFASGNYIGAAVKGISAVKNLGEAVGIFSGPSLSDESYHEDMEKLTQSNERLNDSLDNLSNVIANANITEVGKLFDAQIDAWKELQDNTSEQLRRTLAIWEDGGTWHSDKDSSGADIADKLSDADWRKLSEVTGYDFMQHARYHEFNSFGRKATMDERSDRAEALANLTPEEMRKIRDEAPALWRELLEAASTGVENASEYLEEYAALADKMDELNREHVEKLTSLSFSSIVGDYKNAIMQMDDMNKNMTENFEGYLKQAIVNSFASKYLEKDVDKWMKALGYYMEDGEITSDEKNKLMHSGGTYQYTDSNGNRVTDSFKGVDDLNETASQGVDLLRDLGFTSSKEKQQSATYNSAQQITYEQADTIAGTLIGHTIILQKDSDNIVAIRDMSERMNNRQIEIRDIAADSRDILAGMAIHVEEIRDGVVDTIVPKIKNIDDELVRVRKLVEAQ